MTGSATWRNLQHGDLYERDCLPVRMANKSHCVVARLKVLTIEAEPCSSGMTLHSLLPCRCRFCYFYRCKVSRLDIRRSPVANNPHRQSEVLLFRI